MTQSTVAIIGVGPGNGEAIARRFHRADCHVALLARSDDAIKPLATELGERAAPFVCDATDPAQVSSAFSAIGDRFGEPDVLIYNAGGGRFRNIEQTEAADLEQDWRVNVLGLFHCIRAVLPAMQARGSGTIIGTGATAALRGSAGFLPFAQAKAAQRSLLESTAKHLGPQGIHVAYVIVDGVVDLPRTREMMGDKPDEFFIQPEHLAQSVYFLSQQPRSAWTFQLDLRPDRESW